MRHLWIADLSSSGSSPASFSQVMVGVSVGSCFTLHSNTTERPLWTTLYSGCFRILVGSDGKISKRFREFYRGKSFSFLSRLPFVSRNVGYFSISKTQITLSIINSILSEHKMGRLSPFCSKHRGLLTFDLQVDVILISSKDVPGHTGVFTAVVNLSRVHLQGSVDMTDVRVCIHGAGAAVLEPEPQGS